MSKFLVEFYYDTFDDSGGLLSFDDDIVRKFFKTEKEILEYLCENIVIGDEGTKSAPTLEEYFAKYVDPIRWIRVYERKH